MQSIRPISRWWVVTFSKSSRLCAPSWTSFTTTSCKRRTCTIKKNKMRTKEWQIQQLRYYTACNNWLMLPPQELIYYSLHSPIKTVITRILIILYYYYSLRRSSNSSSSSVMWWAIAKEIVVESLLSSFTFFLWKFTLYFKSKHAMETASSNPQTGNYRDKNKTRADNAVCASNNLKGMSS